MTVAELIELLGGFPQDAPVIFNLHSDVAEMHPEDVKLRRKEDRQIILRNGRYETFKDHWWPKDGGEPPFVTVVNFPGN